MVERFGHEARGGRVMSERAFQDFIHSIERSGRLPSGIGAKDAAAAALCTLSLRLSGGAARELVATLSPTLQSMLQPCVRYREEQGEVFDRGEFLRRVAEQVRIGPEETEDLVRTVFAELQARMPTPEIDDVESQMPPDLKDLWRLRH